MTDRESAVSFNKGAEHIQPDHSLCCIIPPTATNEIHLFLLGEYSGEGEIKSMQLDQDKAWYVCLLSHQAAKLNDNLKDTQSLF